jgi:hypothetical protein
MNTKTYIEAQRTILLSQFHNEKTCDDYILACIFKSVRQVIIPHVFFIKHHQYSIEVVEILYVKNILILKINLNPGPSYTENSSLFIRH